MELCVQEKKEVYVFTEYLLTAIILIYLLKCGARAIEQWSHTFINLTNYGVLVLIQ
jgi:hypothetical protein